MKWLKWISVGSVAIGIIVVILASIVYRLPQFGGPIAGTRLERVQKSPEFIGGRFENSPPQNRDMEYFKILGFYLEGQVREPQFPIPVLPIAKETLDTPASEALTATWLGHASVLVEIGGVRFLTDPVLSDVVSPFPVGPTRLHPSPLSISDLQKIDGVLISHDHYDHLDMVTIQKLIEIGAQFFVPLGIGAHLERWGAKPEQIHEMDWWQTQTLKGVEVHCTPARHYSGRKRMDNSTLWSSWFVKGGGRSFYFSGDTGYAPHFGEIKNRLGPVDLTLMKVGAYGDSVGWIDIHMDPESAVQAHLDLGAKTLLPIHWATFNLAYHAWAEPIERTLKAAEAKNVRVLTPRIGERYDEQQPFTNQSWYLKP